MSRLLRHERRNMILEAARKTLAARGFLGTRAQDVAEAAQVSPALLFRYYPTMRALRKAVVADARTRKSLRWPRHQFTMAPRLAMRSIASSFRSVFDRDPSLLRLALFGALSGDPDSVEPYRREVLRTSRRIASLVRAWKRMGWAGSAVNPRIVAGVCVSSLVHSVLMETVFGFPATPSTLSRDIQAIVAFLEHSALPVTPRRNESSGEVRKKPGSSKRGAEVQRSLLP